MRDDRAIEAARRALVEGGRRLGRGGVIRPGEGNLSLRAGAWLVITPAGRDKAALAPEEMVVLPFPGDGAVRWREVPLPPGASSETRMHLAILFGRPDVTAVVHAHPPAVLEAAARGLAIGGPGGEPPRVPPLPPGSVELAAAAASALGAGRPACVLVDHGAVTVGSTVPEAVELMLMLEEAALEALRRAGAGDRREWVAGRGRFLE